MFIKSVDLKLFKDSLQNITQYHEYVSYDKTLIFIIYIFDLCNASKLFKMIIYADGTTSHPTLDVFGCFKLKKNLNWELKKSN